MTGPAITTAAELVLLRCRRRHRGLFFEDQTRGRGARSSPRRGAGPRSCWTCAATRAVPRRRAAREHRRVRLPADRRGLAGAVVVGINPTRRGAELARDINHTDCQLIVTDATMRPSARRPRPGSGARPDARSSTAATTGRARAAVDDGAGPTRAVPTPDELVPAHLHLGLDRRAEGGADDPGPCRPGRRRHGLRPRRRPLLGHAAVPRQRLVGAVLPGARRRAPPWSLRRRFSASGFLPDVRALRRHLLQHRRAGPRPHPGHSPDRPTTATTGSSSCSAPRPRPPTRPRSPERFGVPVFEGTDRARTPSSSCPVPDAPTGRARAGPGRDRRRRGRSRHRRGATARPLRRARPAAQRRPRRSVSSSAAPPRLELRGLLQQSRGRRRAHPQRLVLVG